MTETAVKSFEIEQMLYMVFASAHAFRSG